MGEVISFGHDGILKHTSYTSDDSDDLGVGTLNNGVEIRRLNDNEFILITPDGSQVYKRRELAEFLWLAATFIDSEERHKPIGELVACEY